MKASSSKPASLEFALRDFFGIVDEPISVDAKTLAQAVYEIATEDGLDVAASGVLMSVVAALSDRHSEWRLTLNNRRSGKRRLLHERSGDSTRDADIANEVSQAILGGDPTEAAIQRVMTTRKMSRAAVFKALQRHREREELYARLRDSLPPFPPVSTD